MNDTNDNNDRSQQNGQPHQSRWQRWGPVVLIVVLLAAGAWYFSLIGRGPTGPTADDVAVNNRGVGLMGMFRYAAARDVFAELVEAHPGWHDLRLNLAIATLNRQLEGDEARALELLEAILAEDPNHLAARYCAGLLHYRAGDARALDYLRAVAEADPDDTAVAYFYASALEQAGRHDEALALYRSVIGRNPYLRSAYYRASRVLLRQGRSEEGLAMQEQFQRLEDNPRATTIDFIYTKMGPKGETIAVGITKALPAPAPAGPIFADPQPLAIDGRGWPAAPSPERRLSITAADFGGDARPDLYITGALEGDVPNAVIIAGTMDTAHPLARVRFVNAALWGDYDNDGLTDVYLCRNGANQLWRQSPPGQWQDVTRTTGTAGRDADTVDGAMFDADHDGDLDLFLVNADEPNDLLNNNLDGTFRSIGSQAGVSGDGRPSRQVLVSDLDRDRDVDIVVLHDQPPHDVFINDRLWQYRPADPAPPWATVDLTAIVAGDLDADGQVEVFGRRADGVTWRWTRDDQGHWADQAQRAAADTAPDGHTLALGDFNGDGRLELAASSAGGWEVVAPGEGTRALAPVGALAGWAPVLLEPGRGPSIIGIPTAGGLPVIWGPGSGRHPFLALRFTGKDDSSQEMRSNASGIGVFAAMRTDEQWTAFDTFRATSGPGQSLQPVAIGLGGAPHADFVLIDWPDGVFQSEVNGILPVADAPPRNLAAGHIDTIEEIQRQTSSCPVLFVWDGARYAFVTDLLGVGGLGYMVAPGEYAPPRPWENVLLPDGLMRSREGRFLVKLSEPMEEACYLDVAALVAWDLPPGWRMTLDERMSILGPEPTGEPRFFREEVHPRTVVNDRGTDVAELVRDADLRAAPVGARDHRFLGRLRAPHALTLTFDEPLAGAPVLVIDGWIEYPYSQTMFAAWQAGAAYEAPTLEALGDDGRWHVVYEQFGYPAGMPRRMSIGCPTCPRTPPSCA